MLKLKTILAPVDFSERSTAAAEHAVALANHFGAQLIFAHVVSHSPYEYSALAGGYFREGIQEWEKERQSHFQKQLDALASQVAQGRPAETLLLEGDPAHKIEELAQRRHVDLLIMPTHGHGPFRRLLLGSVTAKVLHDVTCPVFTGAHVEKLPPFQTDPYRTVACAVDLREHSEFTLRWAWDFAQAWSAKLIVIHAAPFVEPAVTSNEVAEMVIQGARERLEKLLEEVGCAAALHVESAPPSQYVPQAAEKAGADIVVIGRPPAGLLGRLRRDAYAIIAQSHCPVISV